MFSYGYCYGNNERSVRGYKQEGLVKTASAAEKAIRSTLANQGKTKIEFKPSGKTGKSFRAYANQPGTYEGAPENYIYFKLPETWALIDFRHDTKKAVAGTGPLDELKIAARKLVGEPAVQFVREGGGYRVNGFGVMLVKIA